MEQGWLQKAEISQRYKATQGVMLECTSLLQPIIYLVNSYAWEPDLESLIAFITTSKQVTITTRQDTGNYGIPHFIKYYMKDCVNGEHIHFTFGENRRYDALYSNHFGLKLVRITKEDEICFNDAIVNGGYKISHFECWEFLNGDVKAQPFVPLDMLKAWYQELALQYGRFLDVKVSSQFEQQMK